MKRLLLFFLSLLCIPGLLAHEGFDAPLKQKKVSLPQIPGVPNSRNHVACFYFDHFMVKQIDMGDIGADQLSIIPVGENTGGPPCQRDRIPGEISIPKEGTTGWSGYFKGAKSHFVFFDADDGFNGALAFAIYDAKDGKKLFEDNAVGALIFTKSSESAIALRYERAYVGSCSIPREGKSCWNKISAEIHMNSSKYPDCAAGYLKSKAELSVIIPKRNYLNTCRN
ncbi:MAG: hypothetical protein JXA73_03005 [Acidobacteria bacterium]|nr:hypothetical protein [Acidobacteriota bacterium]